MIARIAALVLLLLIGFGTGRLCLRPFDREGRTPFAVSTLAGLGLLAGLLANASVLGLPHPVLRALAWMAAAAGLLLHFKDRSLRTPAHRERASLLVLLPLVMPAWIALELPLLAHDALLIWWPKVEEVLGGVRPTLDRLAPPGAPPIDQGHPEYPRGGAWLAALVQPLVPDDPGWLRLQTLGFTALAGLALARPGLPFARSLVLPAAAVALLLLPDVAMQAHSGLADLPLAAMILLTGLGLSGGREGRWRVLAVGGALGASAFKEEGVIVLGTVGVVLLHDLVRIRERRVTTLLALAALGVAIPWWTLRAQVPGGVLSTLSVVLSDPPRLLARCEALIGALATFSLDPGALVQEGEVASDAAFCWSFWVVLVSGLLLLPRGPRPVNALPALGLLAADLAVYVATPNELHWHLRTSFLRLLVQVTPLLLLAVVARSVRARTIAPGADESAPSGHDGPRGGDVGLLDGLAA